MTNRTKIINANSLHTVESLRRWASCCFSQPVSRMLVTVLEWLTDFLTGAIMESRKAARSKAVASPPWFWRIFNLDAKHGPLEIGDYDKNGKWRRQWKLDSNGKSSEKTPEGWEGYFGKDGIFGKNGKYGEHPPKSLQKFKWNGKGAFWKKGAILTKKNENG